MNRNALCAPVQPISGEPVTLNPEGVSVSKNVTFFSINVHQWLQTLLPRLAEKGDQILSRFSIERSAWLTGQPEKFC